MKKMILLLWLMAAPLMAQHATQFAYYTATEPQPNILPPDPSQTGSEVGDGVSAAPIVSFDGVYWDADTAVQTEGFALESSLIKKGAAIDQGPIITAPLDTILIHHAGWYLAKFLLTGESGNPQTLRFGLLNLDEIAIIPFSVYAVETGGGEVEQLAGQVVFYVPANTRIQLVNDGNTRDTVTLDPISVTSIYLFELLGR